MEAEAQGRLRGTQPVSVIDIGSNSVRLVVYEGLTRSPAVIFNEKILCGLGRGIAATGRLNEEGVGRALDALRRFRALSWQAGARQMHVLATAASREAENGPEFVHRAERILGQEIRILSGREEAKYSALGVISGFRNPDGIAGDLGGGSLELVDVKGSQIGDGITLPLGGLRLLDVSAESTSKARSFTRQNIRKAAFLKNGQGRSFYAVGGTWRNLAKLHMEMTAYPLHMMHAYEIPFAEAIDFLKLVEKAKPDKLDAMKAISKNRRSLLPLGAIALSETLQAIKPRAVAFSALGVREGYLFSLLDDEVRGRDPLLAAAEEISILRARSPEHARELADWTGEAFEVFGIQETDEESRYRRAACFLADISWRAHPDYRGSQALNIISHSAFVGITHPGRAYIALTNYYRFEGLNDDHVSSAIAKLATPRFLEYAKLLGALLRVVYLLSASMSGVVRQLHFRKEGDQVLLVVPKALQDLVGERVEGRLQQLAKLTGRTLAIRIE